jgi:hypothetical protein
LIKLCFLAPSCGHNRKTFPVVTFVDRKESNVLQDSLSLRWAYGKFSEQAELRQVRLHTLENDHPQSSGVDLALDWLYRSFAEGVRG